MSASSSGAAGGGFKFPEALLKSPKCFIALSGLDTRNNAVHRAVFDEFCSGGRRAERKPVVYKNFPADHLYPKCCENVRNSLRRLLLCYSVWVRIETVFCDVPRPFIVWVRVIPPPPPPPPTHTHMHTHTHTAVDV